MSKKVEKSTNESVIDLSCRLSNLCYVAVQHFNRATQFSLGVNILNNSNKILYYCKMCYKRKDVDDKIEMLSACAEEIEYISCTIDNLYNIKAISLKSYSEFSELLGKLELGIKHWFRFIKSKTEEKK